MPRERGTTPTPSPEIESLEQILEPERTGHHRHREGKSPSWLVIALIMLVLAAAAAITVVLVMRR